MDRRHLVFGLTLAAVLADSADAGAQSNNTIRIIFPYAAGGSGDATIRLIADKMQASLKSAGCGREPHRRRRPYRRVSGQECGA